MDQTGGSDIADIRLGLQSKRRIFLDSAANIGRIFCPRDLAKEDTSSEWVSLVRIKSLFIQWKHSLVLSCSRRKADNDNRSLWITAKIISSLRSSGTACLFRG